MLKRIPEIKSTTYLFALFFFLVFIYFFWFGTYVLLFQENQSLFIFSSQYLHEFASKPGGLLVYAATFLTQFYIYPFIGSLIIAVTITLTGFLIHKIGHRINPGSPLIALLAILSSGILLLMQTHYFHLMEYNLGLLLVLFILNLSLGLTKTCRFCILILFPVFYYIAGAYALAYLVLFLILFLLLHKGKHASLFVTVLLLITASTFFLFKNVLFLVPFNHLLNYPFPFVNDSNHRTLLLIYIGLLAISPVLVKSKGLTRRTKKKRVLYPLSVSAVFILIVFYLFKFYNPQSERVVQMEKLIVQEKWLDAIAYQEKFPAENLIGQYFYNVALAESDQLTDRLFYGRQDFNAAALILPWNKDYLNWGVHFFYTVGMVNEAHRWAYEEMVVFGKRPVNMKFLVKTNLINGNYKRAEIFLNELKKTYNYRKWAKEYEKLLSDTTLISSHSEIGSKRKILPQAEFITEVSSPQNNLPFLLNANPSNKKACEYLMAWLLLTKDVETLMNNLGKLKELNYEAIPRHIEEAILAYYNNTHQLPELYGYQISDAAVNRYKRYVSTYNTYKNNPSLLRTKLEKDFGNTFWFYFHFK